MAPIGLCSGRAGAAAPAVGSVPRFSNVVELDDVIAACTDHLPTMTGPAPR